MYLVERKLAGIVRDCKELCKRDGIWSCRQSNPDAVVVHPASPCHCACTSRAASAAQRLLDVYSSIRNISTEKWQAGQLLDIITVSNTHNCTHNTSLSRHFINNTYLQYVSTLTGSSLGSILVTFRQCGSTRCIIRCTIQLSTWRVRTRRMVLGYVPAVRYCVAYQMYGIVLRTRCIALCYVTDVWYSVTYRLYSTMLCAGCMVLCYVPAVWCYVPAVWYCVT
jgi:hypothetical protein